MKALLSTSTPNVTNTKGFTFITIREPKSIHFYRRYT